VAMTVPTGLTIGGSPITTSGTLALTYTAGYEGLATTDKNNWNTAYGWGDHSIAGYNLQAFASSTYAIAGGAFHDGFSDFVANEHIDWTGASAGTIHATNYVDNNTTYTATYPITLTGTAFGIAFGTTTSNTWAGTQTFTNNIAGSITGNAATVSTITGLAPDTATTQAAQPNITSLGTLTGLTIGSATSTASNGFDISAGCFAISGTCLTGGGGGWDALSDISLAKGNFIVGNDAGVAQATSSIFISSTGNVGIGTTTPGGARLSLQSSVTPLLSLDSTGAGDVLTVKNSGVTMLRFGFSSDVYSYAGGADFSIGSNVGNFNIGTNGDNIRLVIDTSGNVGIGLPQGLLIPHYLLDVRGNIGTTGTLYATSTVIDTSLTLSATGDLIIPYSTNPTVATAYELDINTTAASTSLRFHDNTAERALYDTVEKTFTIASSTFLAFLGDSATSTIDRGSVFRPQTWLNIGCYASSTGSAGLRFGDGANWGDYIAVSTWGAGKTISFTALTTNNTFIMGEPIMLEINPVSITRDITCTVNMRYDAD